MGAFHHFWLQAREDGFGGDLGDYCLELQAARAERFAIDGNAPELSYAYHLDAARYARHLRTLAEGAGARRIEGFIDCVEQDGESGDIAALALRSGERIEGDLFIDCTGFRAMLIGQTLGSPFENWRHWLPTDSAVVAQTRSVGPAVPYTQAIAHGAGWRWRIPLQHRVGNGLVYDSRHLSADEANAQLLAEVDGEVMFGPRLIRFQPGRRQDVWRGNCLALGLAGGFVEPVESTAIHLAMIGITRLLQVFPFGGNHAATAKRFNEQAAADIERIRDFIVLHYVLTERDDTPFWDAWRTMVIPETLSDRIVLFRESGTAYQDGEEIFRVASWAQVMIGQGLNPHDHHRMGRIMGKERLRQVMGEMRSHVSRQVSLLPTHHGFVGNYCKNNKVSTS